MRFTFSRHHHGAIRIRDRSVLDDGVRGRAGDSNPRYVDSLKSGHLIAHPVFPVCLALRAMGPMDQLMFDAGLTREESIRRVHATQDMILHRPIRPPEKIFVTTTLALMERRKPGTYLVTRYDIKDSAGAPIATLNWGRIFRGVEMDGPDRVAEIASAPKVHAHAGESAVREAFRSALRIQPRSSTQRALVLVTQSISIRIRSRPGDRDCPHRY